jgi:hypothetical protein
MAVSACPQNKMQLWQKEIKLQTACKASEMSC